MQTTHRRLRLGASAVITALALVASAFVGVSTALASALTQVTCAPISQTLVSGGTATVDYSGPSTRLAALFLDGQLLDFGSIGSALNDDGATVSLPWSWFGDTTAHTVDLRVYGSDYLATQGAPGFTDDYVSQAVVAVASYVRPLAISPVRLPTLKVGRAFKATLNLTSLTHGFDWSYGGSVSITGLPAGLTARIVNPSGDTASWTADGVAPQVLVSGTPQRVGVVRAQLTVSDQWQSARAPMSLVVEQLAAALPAQRTLRRTEFARFVITGVHADAKVIPAAKSCGVASIKVRGTSITVNVNGSFTGVVRQAFTVVDRGARSTVVVTLHVLP